MSRIDSDEAASLGNHQDLMLLLVLPDAEIFLFRNGGSPRCCPGPFHTERRSFIMWVCWKKAASGVPCLRRSGFAQAGRHFSVLTYYAYAPRVKMAAAFPSSGLRTGLDDFFEPTRSL
jgi:hypothetical protein